MLKRTGASSQLSQRQIMHTQQNQIQDDKTSMPKRFEPNSYRFSQVRDDRVAARAVRVPLQVRRPDVQPVHVDRRGDRLRLVRHQGRRQGRRRRGTVGRLQRGVPGST